MMDGGNNTAGIERPVVIQIARAVKRMQTWLFCSYLSSIFKHVTIMYEYNYAFSDYPLCTS